MIIRREQLVQALDRNNGVDLRNFYEQLRGWLANERSSWDGHWATLARFILPLSPRWNYDNVDNGQRKDFDIVDNTATFALRTLGAGMMSGISSPSRPWFHLTMDDPQLAELDQVKEWLSKTEDVIRQVFIKSNVYQSLHTAYRELGLYGTTAFLVLEDEKDGIRCHPYPVGSYYLSGDETLRVDFSMRITSMTARQIVDRFGFENCSSTVQQYYTSPSGGQKEQWLQVVHVVHRNKYFGDQIGPNKKEWCSNYYELSSYKDHGPSQKMGMLREAGFDEFPIIAARWEVTGENFYGFSPAMDCLGDTMGLQLLQKRKMQAIDKMVNPPLVVDPSMRAVGISVLPGAVNYADTRDGSHGVKAAYQVDFKLDHAQQDIQSHQKRIQRALYEDLFLMLAQSDRREVTAEEIRAKQEEKMLVLGPVLERTNDEMLKPLLTRTIGILHRQGRLPPIPDVMKGRPYRVDFISILAQAQKMLGIAQIDRLMAMVGNEVAVDQGILDNVNLDKAVQVYADLLGVDPTILRSEDEIASLRADRQQQQQQAAAAENAQKLADAGKNLSQADINTPSALTALLNKTGPA